MFDTAEDLRWYAIQVSSKKEKEVTSLLANKGYECYLPLYTKVRILSDRRKLTSVPLFSGYVFSRFDVEHRLPILVTPNVRGVVGSGKIPIPVPEQDLDGIRALLQSGCPIEPCDCLIKGDLVRVTKGPLTGTEGTFVQYRSACRLVLSVSLINRSATVQMDRSWVEPVARRSPPEY